MASTGIIRRGTTLAIELGDLDRAPIYLFAIDDARNGLTVRIADKHAVESIGEDADGLWRPLRVTARALKSARGVVTIGGGALRGLHGDDDVVLGERADEHIVPWLLPREAFRALQAGEAVDLQPQLDAPGVDAFTKVSDEATVLPLDTGSHVVDAIRIRGKRTGTEMVVVDDDQWPLIVSWSERGLDVGLRLVRAGVA